MDRGGEEADRRCLPRDRRDAEPLRSAGPCGIDEDDPAPLARTVRERHADDHPLRRADGVTRIPGSASPLPTHGGGLHPLRARRRVSPGGVYQEQSWPQVRVIVGTEVTSFTRVKVWPLGVMVVRV